MMIGVPSHVAIAVDVRSGMCFLGRADAVVAVARTTTAKARVTILDSGTLMLVEISTSYWHPLLAGAGRHAFFTAHGRAIFDVVASPPTVHLRFSWGASTTSRSCAPP